MRRIYIIDQTKLIFRKREITDQILIDDSGIADFIQDDRTISVSPPWLSQEPEDGVASADVGFLIDDNGDKVA